MPTKAELQAQIAHLERIIDDQEKALNKLANMECVEIKTPNVNYAFASADAPYVKEENGSDPWQEKVMPSIIDTIRTHGVQHPTARSFCKNTMNLIRDGYYPKETRILVPKIVATFVRDFINAAAQFGKICRAEGVKQGANLLTQLAQDRITSTEFDEKFARESKCEDRPSKKITIRVP